MSRKHRESRLSHVRLADWVLAALLAAVCGVYFAGALAARPGVEVAAPDLVILREWMATGQLPHASRDPGHLAKPGHLLFLRLVLPAGGTDAELRRLLLINAAWIASGIAALVLAVRLRVGSRAAAWTAFLLLLCLPLRDSADYVLTEPLAVGSALWFAAAFILGSNRKIALLFIGIGVAALALLRPNLAYALAAVGSIVLLSNDETRRRTVHLLLGFVVGLVVLGLVGRATNLPLSPLGMSPSQALFFGSVPYSWPPEIGSWPAGETPEETSRLQVRAASQRWREALLLPRRDRNRFILWKLTHGVLSTEQLPARWDWPPYLRLSELVRRWWWLAMILAISLSVTAAAASDSPWRFAPLCLFLFAFAQSLLLGAETRYTLPMIPVALLGLVLAHRSPKRRPAALAAGAATALGLFWIILQVPDTTAADYAVARPASRIQQTVPASAFGAWTAATLHLRILAFPWDSPPGFELFGNGELLFTRGSNDTSLFPAQHSVFLTGATLNQARAKGLELELRVLSEPSQGKGLTYPVVPAIFSRPSRIDGMTSLPTGFGGPTRGGIPAWVHEGVDPLPVSEPDR